MFTLIGKYIIRKVLAFNGFDCAVIAASHVEVPDKIDWVLKVYLTARSCDFQVRLFKLLAYAPNVLHLKEFFEWDKGILKYPVLVFPFVPGKNNIIPSAESPHFFPYFQGLMKAIIAMHAQCVIHCDICPRNVIYNTANKTVTLIDLELAVIIDGNDEGDPWVDRSMVMRIVFNSPHLKFDMRRCWYYHDVWAIGVMYIMALTRNFEIMDDVDSQENPR